MRTHGLNLGALAFSASRQPYTPPENRRRSRRRPRVAATSPKAHTDTHRGATEPRLFELSAGNVPRPLRERPSVSTTVAAVVLHMVAGAGILVTVAVGQVPLPEVPNMMAFVATGSVAPPAPPPPPAPPAPAAVPQAPETAPLPTDAEFLIPVEAPIGIGEETGLQPPGLPDGGVDWGVEGGVPWTGGDTGILAAPPTAPPPPPPAAREPVRVGGAIGTPELVHRVEPSYPPAAMNARIQGLVVLEATVNENGDVSSVQVLRSVQFLDEAAIDAVKQWRYTPLSVDGRPTPFILTVTLNFRLS